VTVVAVLTGGIASFAAIWLVVVPLEAALSASRRVVATASTFALGRRRPVGVAGHPKSAAAAESQCPCRICGAGHRFSSTLCDGARARRRGADAHQFWLLYAEEDRYRLLARNITDVITRHGRDGAVLFVSPAAESLFVPSGGIARAWSVRSRSCR